MLCTRSKISLMIPILITGISIFGFTTLFVQASTARVASTHTVCTSGCDFSSIQAAIDAATTGDTINLAAETFTEPFTIDKSLTIEGAGSENTFLQAAVAPGVASSRVITVTGNVTATINGVTIRYGVASTGRGGGGVLNAGTLTIENSTIYSNTADFGGGITNQKILTLTHCIVDNNEAISWGGGIFVDNSSYNPPDATVITIQDSTISNNFTHVSSMSDSGGGGLYSYNSTANISSTTIISNSVNGSGDGGGGVHINYRSIATINNSLIAGNTADIGGGIKNEFESQLSVHSTTVRDNFAERGGGIYNEQDSTIDLLNCTISGNQANVSGGGLYNYDGSTANIGSTLFSNNTTGVDGYGGGIYNRLYSAVNIWNSTLSGNSAGRKGGGIDNYYFSVTSAQQLTFEGNSAQEGGSDVSSRYGTLSQPSVIFLEASILSGDIAQGNCYVETGTNEAHVNDNGYNIIEDGTCITTASSFAADPMLGVLLDNGGETNTHALLAGSPAIDIIPIGSCDLADDQRGVSRPQGDGCDIGAYEVELAQTTHTVYLPHVVK